MNREVSVTLDVAKHDVPDDVTAVIQQGENVSLTIIAAVVNEGEAFDLAGKSAQFACIKPDGKVVLDDAEVTDAAAGVLSYDVAASVASSVGKITVAYFILSDDTGWAATTECMAIKVTQGIGAGDVESSDDYLTITRLLGEVRSTYDVYKSVEEDVKGAADTIAKISEAVSAANAAAEMAGASAAKAVESAGNADKAAEKAGEAASAADTAREAAQQVVDDEAGHRAAAKASADAAAKSAVDAAQSASAASASAGEAEASKSAASTSATSAADKADKAASSESNASASANSALASKEGAEAAKAAADKSAKDAEDAASRAAAIADLEVTNDVAEGGTGVVTAAGVYSYVTEVADGIRTGMVEVVSELPSKGRAGVIYMVAADNPADGNLYSEHVYKDGKWETLGDVQMPDLSPYAKTAEVAEAIQDAVAAYTTTEDLTALLAAKQDAMAFDAVPTEGSANTLTSGAVWSALASKANAATVAALGSDLNALTGTVTGKQDKLTIDGEVTAGSANPVSSKAVKEYVDVHSAKVEYLSNADFIALLGV